jgi:hypothetical protein
MVAPLFVAAEEKANFGEFAFEFLLVGVEFRVATCGKFFGQVEKAGCNGMMIGEVLHGLNPFSGRAGTAARPG